MQFVHQALTWGFLLALLPLVIHLINLVRRRRVRWAAMEFLLTAEHFSAERALELGLINEIVKEEDLLERAYDWARRINVNAPLAVQATKESVMRGLGGSLEEAYGIEMELSRKVFKSDDAKEGPKAFAEKRPPRWSGK